MRNVGERRMAIVDAQLHEPAVSFAWEGGDQSAKWNVMLEVKLAYMRAVGVDRALLFPTTDLPWAQFAAERLPDTFGVVPAIGGGIYGGIDAAPPTIAQKNAEQAASPRNPRFPVVRPDDPLQKIQPAPPGH